MNGGCPAPSTSSSRAARCWLAAATALLCLARANTSRADDPGERDDWYGSHTLAADAGALLLLVTGVATNDRDTSQKLVVGSGVIYLLGGPVVHLLHQRELTSLASLGLRAGAPTAGGLVGAALGGTAAYDDGNEVIRGTVYGVMAGLLGAVILDAALLAWQPAPSSSARAGPSFTWRPACSSRRRARSWASWAPSESA